MKTQAIVVAAGLGVRLKANIPKAFVVLNKKPLFIYALQSFEKSGLVDSVILVGHKDKIKDYQRIVKKFRLKKVNHCVVGGITRRESVFNGLSVTDGDTRIVLVHDAARPLVTPQLIDMSVKECLKNGAVVTAVPVKPTIKRVNLQTMNVEETLNRDELWEIQTPQVFPKSILLKAHTENPKTDSSDDAVLVEHLGLPVKVIMGDYKNIKVTTQEDLFIAESLLKKKER